MSDAATAIAALDKAVWSTTTAGERLELLLAIQKSICEHEEELGAGESAIKNGLTGDKAYDDPSGMITAVCPIAANVSGAIDLYKALAGGKEFKPTGEITKVADEDLYDIPVAPYTAKDKVFYAFRSDRLRVKGKPIQKGPYDKETKLVAVLGAGNYTAPPEIIKALFYDSCVVVYKPHPLNTEISKLWEKILKPLVDIKALSFCADDQGPMLTKSSTVEKIYFIGGASTAQAILKDAKAPLVTECGGVNPTIIVPGEREWTQSELKHHAQQIVSMGKINGGAVCARPQLIVTCKNWAQREAFVKEVELAISENTIAAGTYYPGWKERMDGFAKAYPDAKCLQPENGVIKSADVLFVSGDKEDSYSAKNEAFCQVFTEVPLDTPSNAKEFLEYAVAYSNDKVVGTLCATIILDEKTRKNNAESLEKAITNLRFGSVGVNLLAAHVFFSPYLAWCGHDDDKEGTNVVSGKGDFGNLFGFENIEKNIVEDAFVSPGQMKCTNKAANSGTIARLAKYNAWPSWWNLVKLLSFSVAGSLKSKDW